MAQNTEVFGATRQAPISAGTRISSGIHGLDDILGGGLTARRLYLIEGTPGTGKTTFALQFLLDGAARGERAIYITLSESAEELQSAAATHGWSLAGIEVFELLNETHLERDSEQSILHPSELELGETVQRVMQQIESVRPARVVFDSLSEMRLLAQNPLRYRRQILALKHFFVMSSCTVMLLDDPAAEPSDSHVHSIAHGVITLEQTIQEFGVERRRLRVVKMRGTKFRGGHHDLTLDTGGIRVYPRLIASEHDTQICSSTVPTGCDELDQLLGGGLVPGSNTLLIGPSGVGKTTVAVRAMVSALQRGERCAYFLFDEGLGTLIARCSALGLDIRPHLASGMLALHQVAPAEIAPGEFTAHVRHAVETDRVKFVCIDSLSAYLQAMPGERFLLLQMHELLNFLNQKGIVTLLVIGQHGLVGELHTDVDLSYLSDTIVLFRFFEAKGEILSAISVIKSRTNAHERTIRQLKLNAHGVTVGKALHDFEGVMSGLPTYRGDTPMIGAGR